MAGVQESDYGGRLWRAEYGTVRLDALEPYCIIDRTDITDRAASVIVRGGGVRTFGLRDLAPARHLREAQAAFFTNLKGSVAEVGVKLPILLWAFSGKLYVRYGASRVYVSRELGLDRIPAVICHFHDDQPDGFIPVGPLRGPAEALILGFGNPAVVGHFEWSHERLDAHRMEP